MTKEERLELANTKEFKCFMTDLAYFAETYIFEVVAELVKDAVKIYQDKTVVNLLSKYHENKLKEIEYHANDMLSAFKVNENIFSSIETSRYNCLTNSKSYQQVLYDLLVAKR